MYKRVYGVTLRPDIPDAEKQELISVLENTPAYIPGTTHSAVHPALGATPFDLLWVNAFVDGDHYEQYLAHPYHCNVIDHYMYRESPAASISHGLVMRWEDDLPVSGPADASASSIQKVASKKGDDMVPEAPMTVDPQQGPLVIVEQVDVLPGKTDEYLAALEDYYRPMVESKGLKQLMCLRSPAGSGEEELCLMWEVANWKAFVDYRAYFQFGKEPDNTDWLTRINALRSGGRRRIMLPVSGKAR